MFGSCLRLLTVNPSQIVLTTCTGQLCGSGIRRYRLGASAGPIPLVVTRNNKRDEKSALTLCRLVHDWTARLRVGATPRSLRIHSAGLAKRSNQTERLGKLKVSSKHDG